jgi:uncharacterized protein Usg
MMDERKTLFEKQFFDGYNLTTAEIIYHMPDRPHILQTYLWQDYDLAPKYPVLTDFLQFWEKELDGPLHSIILAEQRLIKADEFLHYAGEYTLQ